MSTIPEFEKRYLDTDGISLYIYLIKQDNEKKGFKRGKWMANVLNLPQNAKQPLRPDSLFGLFDQIITYIEENRKPVTKTFEMYRK